MNAWPTIQDYLQRAKVRDAEKGGGSGLRETREIAEACYITLDTARKHLHRAVDRGEVEAFDSGGLGLSGNAILWRAA